MTVETDIVVSLAEGGEDRALTGVRNELQREQAVEFLELGGARTEPVIHGIQVMHLSATGIEADGPLVTRKGGLELALVFERFPEIAVGLRKVRLVGDGLAVASGGRFV